MHIIFDDAEFRAVLVGVARLEASVTTLQSTVNALHKRSDMAFQEMKDSLDRVITHLGKVGSEVAGLHTAIDDLKATIARWA